MHYRIIYYRDISRVYNTMAVDALAPYFTTSPVAMVLTTCRINSFKFSIRKDLNCLYYPHIKK